MQEFQLSIKDRDIRKKDDISANRDEYTRKLDERLGIFLDSCDDFFEREIICTFKDMALGV